jgi:Beta propeller domain
LAFEGDGSATSIVVFDVSDRAAPRATREFGLSGSLIAARRIGRAVHTVVAERRTPPSYPTSPERLESCGQAEAPVRARFEKLKPRRAGR